jgi:DNA ligase-associated metallophosphoesterase
MLVVADLHIEKGRSIGLRHRRPLPPYDTRETLRRLSDVIARYDPHLVVCLGDSFHDAGAMLSLEPTDKEAIALLASGRRWVWVAGNHDPAIPASMGGERMDELMANGLLFRHDDNGADGVVIGHYHPVAVLPIGGRVIRRRCFLIADRCLIMPAFGSYAGGLNILHPTLTGVAGEAAKIFLLGGRQVHAVPRSRLLGDGGRVAIETSL